MTDKERLGKLKVYRYPSQEKYHCQKCRHELPFKNRKDIDFDFCPYCGKSLLEDDTSDENKSASYKVVFDDLCKINMFKGIYDAKNGKETFMYGISTVMENIAYGVSEECYNNFSTEFTDNMVKSEEKANETSDP